jgi:hypothetical protein
MVPSAWMEKTTVYLEESVKRRLGRMARDRGVSEASLIRTALERLLDDSSPRPTLPLFHSGDPILPDQVDHLLRDGFGTDDHDG